MRTPFIAANWKMYKTVHESIAFVKEFRTLYASAVESSSSQLFSVNPRQSYPKDEWVKGNPDFWKPKAAAPAPAAAKPDAQKKP